VVEASSVLAMKLGISNLRTSVKRYDTPQRQYANELILEDVDVFAWQWI
jgi:hypothetical protein